MSYAVEHYSNDDDYARDNFLHPVGKSDLSAPRSDYGHDQRTDKSANYRAFSAHLSCRHRLPQQRLRLTQGRPLP